MSGRSSKVRGGSDGGTLRPVPKAFRVYKGLGFGV